MLLDLLRLSCAVGEASSGKLSSKQNYLAKSTAVVDYEWALDRHSALKCT